MAFLRLFYKIHSNEKLGNFIHSWELHHCYRSFISPLSTHISHQVIKIWAWLDSNIQDHGGNWRPHFLWFRLHPKYFPKHDSAGKEWGTRCVLRIRRGRKVQAAHVQTASPIPALFFSTFRLCSEEKIAFLPHFSAVYISKYPDGNWKTKPTRIYSYNLQLHLHFAVSIYQWNK